MMRKFLPLLVPAFMLGGCAQQKTALVNHYDDAYFVPSDAAEKPVYSRPTSQRQEDASCDECSYSGSYSDRFRNFGQSGRSHTPGFNPYLGYSNAFGWNYGMNMGFGYYDPWMMNGGFGRNPYMMGAWNNPWNNPWHNPWQNSWYSPWNNPWYWGGGYNPGFGGGGGGGGFGGGGNNRPTTNRLRMNTPNNTLPVYRGPNGNTVNNPQRQAPGNTTGRPAPTASPNAPRNNNTPVQTQPGGNPTSRPTPNTRPTPAPTSRPAPSTQPRPVTPPVMQNNRPPVNNAPAPRSSQPTFSAPPARSAPSPAPSGGGGSGSSGPRRR